jgi:hypothetical protein
MTAPSAATDKGGSKVVLSTNSTTIDALVGAKNAMAQVLVSWPGMTPEKHKFFLFAGSSVPDNTDYPDSIAPIGSLFFHLKVTTGAVAGAALYQKTAAGTWTVIGAVAAA